MDSKGDVRHFFWLVFRKPLARILLLFEAFASGFPRPDVEMISERVQTSVYLAIVFFSMVFLLVYTCFTCFLRFRRARDLFFMDSKAAVWGFRKRFSKARFRDDFGASPDERLPGYSIFFCVRVSFLFRRAREDREELFFMDSKGDVRQFFWLVFRKPLARTLARILLLFEAFASGFPRPDFEMIAERIQTSVYLAIVFFSMVFLFLAIVFFSMVFLLVYTCFTCFLRCRRARDLFFMDSKGDVRHFFWLVFRKPLARILLLFEAFASGFQWYFY